MLARLESTPGVPEKHKGPVRALGVLLFGVVEGVLDQRVVHHRARTFGNAFETPHEADEHFAVILPDLCPDFVAGLIKVTKPMAGVGDAQPLPRAKILTASGGDR